MRRVAQRVVVPSRSEIGVRERKTLLAALGGRVRVLLVASHLHGRTAAETLFDARFWHELGIDMKVVAVFTDDPIGRPEQCNVETRAWRYYHGAERRYIARLVPQLAEAHGVPVCYASTNSLAAQQFVEQLRYKPNTILCCCYHAWIPRWMRQLGGERSGFGGRNFNVHPNDEIGNMERMSGTNPFEEILNGTDRGMRMSLLRLVGSRFDDPEFVLKSTRLLPLPPRIRKLEPTEQMKCLHSLTEPLVRELLREHLAHELLTQLSAETGTRVGGYLPECPAPVYR